MFKVLKTGPGYSALIVTVGLLSVGVAPSSALPWADDVETLVPVDADEDPGGAPNRSIVAIEARSASGLERARADRAPVGDLDSLELDGAVATVEGWAVDPDLSTSLEVIMTIDGEILGRSTADEPRSDVARAFEGVGPDHGFSMEMDLDAGGNEVCVVVLDTDGELSSELGCGLVRVGTSTTAPATTAMPTTAVPTTAVPVTAAPTTAPPATAAPTTAAPVTPAPTTVPPAPPTTAAPTSAPPTTAAPVPSPPPTTHPEAAPEVPQPPETTSAPSSDPVVQVPDALLRIAACESGTGAFGSHSYSAHNPTSSASGAYQFLDSTWNYNATGSQYVARWQELGWENLRLEAAAAPSADAARPLVQDAAAVVHYGLNGSRPWNPSRYCWG